MFSQQESLSQRRLQTEGSIQGLRRHVDKLDQLLSNSSKDSYYFNDQEALPKHDNVIDQKQCSTDTFVLTWANICKYIQKCNQTACIKKLLISIIFVRLWKQVVTEEHRSYQRSSSIKPASIRNKHAETTEPNPREHLNDFLLQLEQRLDVFQSPKRQKNRLASALSIYK